MAEKTGIVQNIKQKILRYRMELTISALIFFLIFLFLFPRIFFTVEPGEGAVLYRRFFGGTIVDRVYGEGFQLIWPWDKLFIYNVRVQENTYQFNVLSKNGLTIGLTVSIRYFPEYKLLGLLHQRVGPDYVKKIILPEITSVMRTTIGSKTAEGIYATRRAVLDKIINEAVSESIENYVQVQDVIIKNIQLPENIQKAIQYKLEQKQMAETYIYKLVQEEREAQRKEIEAGGFERYNTIVDRSLTSKILTWQGIEATRKLAASENAKIVVIGSGSEGLPIILGSGK